VGLLEHDSFQQLLAERGIGPRSFGRNIETLEAADIMTTIAELGDHLLLAARGGRIPAGQAETLLTELMDCYTDPLARALRVFEIRRELRERER
jgi:hypothetical protein